MSSNGPTSSTMVTPNLSQSGRPAGKSSSTTHWRNGSVITGQASSTPSARETRARSASVVAGTMRSTMLDGTGDIVLDDAAPRPASRRPANCDQQPMQRRAVGRQIVAGQDGEGREPARPPARQRLDEKTVRGARRWPDWRGRATMSGCAASRSPARIAQIGLFGDRQRDDADARVGQHVEQGRRILRRHQQRLDRADDAQGLAVAAAHRPACRARPAAPARRASSALAARRRRCPSRFRRPPGNRRHRRPGGRGGRRRRRDARCPA